MARLPYMPTHAALIRELEKLDPYDLEMAAELVYKAVLTDQDQDLDTWELDRWIEEANSVSELILNLSECECPWCALTASCTDPAGIPHCIECVEWVRNPITGDPLCPYHEDSPEEIIEAAIDPEGSWSAVNSQTGEHWPDAPRFKHRDEAEAWVDAWYHAVQEAHGGGQLLWHLMETPVLAHLEGGRWVAVEEDEW